MAPHRVFLTGEPGCGKTTAVRKTAELLASYGLTVGGMISGEIRERGARVGFSLEDILTNEKGTLAHVDQTEGPRVGKYRVNLRDIERIGVRSIERATAVADIIVVDELGPMELHSNEFVHAVETALASPKHFFGTIHKRASHPLVVTVKTNPTCRVIDVTPENRDLIPLEIARQTVGKV